MLRAASLSRVALAQAVGVDKSLVGRWIAGSVHPTDHNLAKISTVLAQRLPGFAMADWFASARDFAARYGRIEVDEGVNAGAPPAAMPHHLGEFLAAAGSAEDRLARSAPYEGFWRTARPSLLMPGDLFHDYGIIRRTPDGLVEVRMGGSGLDFAGYLIPSASNIIVYLFDRVGRSPVTVLCKGVTLPRAMVLDGILMLAALDPARTPAAFPLLVERVGDVTGDIAADDARFAAIVSEQPEPLDPLDREVVRARLYRDCGPSHAAAGGEGFLQVAPGNTLSRGTTGQGLRG